MPFLSFQNSTFHAEEAWNTVSSHIRKKYYNIEIPNFQIISNFLNDNAKNFVLKKEQKIIGLPGMISKNSQEIYGYET